MADPFVAHDSSLLVGLESDQGTTVTPDRTFGYVSGDTDLPDPSVDWLEERSISGGASRELSGKYAGQNTYDGGSIPIFPVDGFPIALAFGNDTTTADTNLDATGAEVSETGTTLHSIDVLDGALPPTVTVEATYFGRGTGTDFVRTFGGVTPGSVTLSVDNESRLSTDLDLMALGVTEGDSPTTSVSEPTRDPWVFDNVSSSLSLNGTEYCRITDFEHELTSNIQSKYYICADAGADPFEHLYANAEHSLTATVTVTDDVLYTELLGRDDAGDASIQFTKPSTGEVLRYEATGIGIAEAPHSLPEEGANEVDLSIVPNTARILVSDTTATSAYL
jgi:hypothetical protein